MLELNKLYNMDCMDGMKEIPDKYFDLAIVDPPYGGGSSQNGNVEREKDCKADTPTLSNETDRGLEGGLTTTISVERTGGGYFKKYLPRGGVFSNMQEDTNIKHWDVAPTQEYFDELARVSKNQIIWGGNYFNLPPTRCFLIWRKLTISENFSMAMCEYAWTSFNDNAKLFECVPQGNKEKRFHPTQKPIALYHWIISRYAKEGDKILDTHAGSGSCLIAAHDTKHDFVGFEIDKFYYQSAQERIQRHFAQTSLF